LESVRAKHSDTPHAFESLTVVHGFEYVVVSCVA
jgi:hypothetical protein